MENWEEEFKKLIGELNINVQDFQEIQIISKEDQKKLKKKVKKFSVDKQDNPQTAIQKTKKLLDQIYKSYQISAKNSNKTINLKNAVTASKTQRDNSINQVKNSQNLQKQFKKKYEDILKDAQQIEKKEEEKRKKLIQELQVRIRTVQEQYETSGKIKIEKYRQNQTLKHQLSKIEPQAMTTQSLMDAQLKKKQIEIQIQMTTLKQKIQMMSNFKKMGEDTKQRLIGAQATQVKIQKRLTILQAKQNQNKIVVARAHLILEQYKKSITKINQLLSKHEKEAIKAAESLKKKSESMIDIEKSIEQLDREYQTQKGQIQILLSLEQNLKKQLAQ